LKITSAALRTICLTCTRIRCPLRTNLLVSRTLTSSWTASPTEKTKSSNRAAKPTSRDLKTRLAAIAGSVIPQARLTNHYSWTSTCPPSLVWTICGLTLNWHQSSWSSVWALRWSHSVKSSWLTTRRSPIFTAHSGCWPPWFALCSFRPICTATLCSIKKTMTLHLELRIELSRRQQLSSMASVLDCHYWWSCYWVSMALGNRIKRTETPLLFSRLAFTAIVSARWLLQVVFAASCLFRSRTG